MEQAKAIPKVPWLYALHLRSPSNCQVPCLIYASVALRTELIWPDRADPTQRLYRNEHHRGGAVRWHGWGRILVYWRGAGWQVSECRCQIAAVEEVESRSIIVEDANDDILYTQKKGIFVAFVLGCD